MITVYYLELFNHKFIIEKSFLDEFIKSFQDFELSGYTDTLDYAKNKCTKLEEVTISNDFTFYEL